MIKGETIVSEEKKDIEVEDGKEKKNRKVEKLNKEIEKLQEELDKLKEDVSHWKNEYYRAYADTQNLRKSLEKDHKEAMKYRAEGFIESLLPVLDSFYIVLKNEPDDPALKNYLIGFQFIYKNLVSALENEGVSEISPNINDKFDANIMNAVEVEESEEKEEGLVTKVMTKGYKLHDRLIRPANVVVSAHPKKDEEENKEDSNKKFDA